MLSKVREQNEGVAYLRRVVDGHLTSALLLVGPSGVGRRFSVLEAVKEAFSEGNQNSPHCLRIDRGIHPDLSIVSPQDGKEIGVDVVREVIEKVYDYPSVAKRRYVLIDGADAMTPAAANALLKTLEEPPSVSQFFLLAESSDGVLPTIRSRRGLVRYKRLSEPFVVEALTPFVPEATKALVYARLAEGSLGRALQFFGSNRIDLRDRVFGLLKMALGRDLSTLFSAVSSVGEDIKLGLHFLDHLLHDMTLLPFAPTRISNLDIAAELAVVRGQIGDVRIRSLRDGLQGLHGTKASKVNVAFHVKACLASTFSK